MAKVVRTIRLYKAHDLDLISFVYTHDINFNKTVYCALAAFVKGEVFNIEMPPKNDNTIKGRRSFEIKLVLDSDRDKDVIDMISLIKERYRNNFIKNLVRMYISNPISEEYTETPEDYAFFTERFDAFRKGRKLANLNGNRVEHNLSSIVNHAIEDTPGVENTPSVPTKTVVSAPVKENVSYAPDIPKTKKEEIIEENTEQKYENLIYSDTETDVDLDDPNTMMQLFKDMTMEA